MSSAKKYFKLRNAMITFFNYDVKKVLSILSHRTVKCYAFQEEICPETSKQHLQLYCEFTSPRTMSSIKKLFKDNTIHIEKRGGTKQQAVDYCTKSDTRKPDTKYYTYKVTVKQGSRSKLDKFIIDYVNWNVSDDDFLTKFPKYYVANFKRLKAMRLESKSKFRMQSSADYFEQVILKPWQLEVYNIFMKQDDRKVIWICDKKGNHGKTFLAKYIFFKHPDDTVIIRGGDVKDIAEAYRMESQIVFDLGRSSDKYISYRALEQLKDGSLTKLKYHSKMILVGDNKILVLSNELPDFSKLSFDRWDVYTLKHEKLTSYDVSLEDDNLYDFDPV